MNERRLLIALTVGVFPTYKQLGMIDTEWRKMIADLSDAGIIEGVRLERLPNDVRISDYTDAKLTEKGFAEIAANEPPGNAVSDIKETVLQKIVALMDAELAAEHTEIDFLERLSRIYQNLQ